MKLKHILIKCIFFYSFNQEKMKRAYYPTHIRFSPWLIGVMAGYILYEGRKRSIRIPKVCFS